MNIARNTKTTARRSYSPLNIAYDLRASDNTENFIRFRPNYGARKRENAGICPFPYGDCRAFPTDS